MGTLSELLCVPEKQRILCGREFWPGRGLHWAPPGSTQNFLVPRRSTWLQVGYLAGKVCDFTKGEGSGHSPSRLVPA